MSWFKQNADLIKVVTLVAAMVVWFYSTFGTIGMVKSAEAGMRLYVDEKHNGVTTRLESMDRTLQKIDDRTVQIIRELK